MSLSAAQLEERRAYLGGTDAAALAGVNPPRWSQPIDVYLDKVGLSHPRPSSTLMSLGSRLEPIVADLFTEATGVKLRRWARPVRSTDYPHMGGHLDRWAADGGIFEAKWTARGGDDWGPSHVVDPDDGLGLLGQPPARIPLHYAVQVQHYLAVTGRSHAWLAVLLGFGDFRWYWLPRAERQIAALIELEGRFWTENVLAGVPPDPDGSESYGRHLRRALAADDGSEAVATPEQAALAATLREARAMRDGALRTYAAAAQAVQLSMGNAAALIGDGFRIDWRQTKPRLTVQWEALATELLRDFRGQIAAEPWPPTKKAAAELIRAEAQERGLASLEEGSRPFNPTFDSDEEDN